MSGLPKTIKVTLEVPGWLYQAMEDYLEDYLEEGLDEGVIEKFSIEMLKKGMVREAPEYFMRSYTRATGQTDFDENASFEHIGRN